MDHSRNHSAQKCPKGDFTEGKAADAEQLCETSSVSNAYQMQLDVLQGLALAKIVVVS